MIIKTKVKLNTINKNGRIYKKENFEDFLPKIKSGRMLGEFGHTTNVDVDLSNVSHTITDLSFLDDNIMEVKAELINTHFKEYIVKNIDSFVLSPRGSGIINENNEIVDYRLITFDLIEKNEISFEVINDK